jgi:CP family cyanate transporter-like MFS transporter
VGLAGFLLAPGWALAWSLLFGIGTGSGIILGLALIGLRTRHATQAASLSGMAQCVGYLLAAIGPMGIGALHDRVSDWTWPLLLCTGFALTAAIMGALAGRQRQV